MDEPQKSGIGHRGLWIVPLFALFVLILVMLQQAPPPGLCVLGDVRERQAGRIPAALFDTAFNAGDFSHGIGSAAADGWEGLGESLLVGGEAFVRSTAHESPQYYRLQRAPRFRTSALTAVPAGTPARSQIILAPGSSMAEVLQRLAVRHPEGVLAAGFVQFE
ncbi:MAG: hypothetical protein OEV31_00625, partial [Gammaproteobacteria bacterium]|nr:hypothetical protein [Gammaproteobacteria bacterium]